MSVLGLMRARATEMICASSVFFYLGFEVARIFP